MPGTPMAHGSGPEWPTGAMLGGTGKGGRGAGVMGDAWPEKDSGGIRELRCGSLGGPDDWRSSDGAARGCESDADGRPGPESAPWAAMVGNRGSCDAAAPASLAGVVADGAEKSCGRGAGARVGRGARGGGAAATVPALTWEPSRAIGAPVEPGDAALSGCDDIMRADQDLAMGEEAPARRGSPGDGSTVQAPPRGARVGSRANPPVPSAVRGDATRLCSGAATTNRQGRARGHGSCCRERRWASPLLPGPRAPVAGLAARRAIQKPGAGAGNARRSLRATGGPKHANRHGRSTSLGLLRRADSTKVSQKTRITRKLRLAGFCRGQGRSPEPGVAFDG